MRGLTSAERAVLLRCYAGEIASDSEMSSALATALQLRDAGRVHITTTPEFIDVVTTEAGKLALRCCPIE